MASIKDVAREAGVSITTVSFVLNNKGNISEETRQQVLEVVRRIGYRPNTTARNLRKDETRIIGYAQAIDVSEYNPLLGSFQHHLVKSMEALNRHVLLFADQKQTQSADIYRELIAINRVDGFVLSYTVQNDERFAYLHDAGVPFVAFGRSLTPLDDVTHWVDVDGEYGIYTATQHLIAQGHSAIGLIGWPLGSASGDQRAAGYHRALTESGLSADAAWIVHTLDGVDHGRAAAQQIMAQSPAPTAIIGLSDALAVGALQAAQESGRRIAVTGFDDNPIGRYTMPTLTTLRQPIAEVVELVIAMMEDQLNGVEVDLKQHLLLPELVVRESSVLS